jgi:hypothetical protein
MKFKGHDTHPSYGRTRNSKRIQADMQDANVTPESTDDKRPTITVDIFMEVLCALHFAMLVDSPINDASGLMLIAPSGSLKTSLLMTLPNLYPNSTVCDSNWYYGKLIKMKGVFYNRTVRSIVVPELSSLYAGDPRTGGRMEQIFQQMAGEGSMATNERDTRWERYEMRAQIFAAMTPDFAAKKHPSWEEGFHRRFLWAHLAMKNEEVLLDYLTDWRRAELEISQPIVEPAQGKIPNLLTYDDKMAIRELLESQKDFGPNHTRFVFLCRALSVLKWHYKRIGSRKVALDTVRAFSVCLSKKAALLTIPEERTAIEYRKKVEHDEVKALSLSKVSNKKPSRTASHRIRSQRNRVVVSRTPPTDNSHQHDDSATPPPGTDVLGTAGDIQEVSKQRNKAAGLD